uniref:Uncharacterized protein n=1 Tax=Graphocephala atropunctata TaxID=36148 RepID=A0A1B6M8Z9_9HEMI
MTLRYSDTSPLVSVAVRAAEPRRSDEFRRATLGTESNREPGPFMMVDDARLMIQKLKLPPAPMPIDKLTARMRSIRNITYKTNVTIFIPFNSQLGRFLTLTQQSNVCYVQCRDRFHYSHK